MATGRERGGATTLRTRNANEDHEDGEDAPHDEDYWDPSFLNAIGVKNLLTIQP